MKIRRIGSQASTPGPADYFTGTVRVDPLFPAETPARTSGGLVTFEPGARSAWHTHPLGQTLIVTAGCGWAQREGGPIEEIRPGDVICFPPGQKHWHGAAPTTAVSHIAIQENLDGRAVDWLEQVSDEQYRKYSGPTFMKISFKDQVALITGAGKGMGLAAATAFAEADAAVVVADIDGALAESVTQQLRAKGHRALGIRCDVSVESEIKAMVEQTVATFGRLDAAFNNAGVQSPAIETADADGEEFDRHIAVNMRGVWACMKYELIEMRKQNSGAIVNNSSIGGVVGLPGRAIYHAAKHGVIGMTKSAALEYASRGISINAVCPGTIDTPMVQAMIAKDPAAIKEILKAQPIGRMGRPEEVASAVVWLCSAQARFVVGHALVIDGGYTAQ